MLLFTSKSAMQLQLLVLNKRMNLALGLQTTGLILDTDRKAFFHFS